MYTSLKSTTTLFCLVTLLAFISCNKDDDQTNAIIVETEDLTIDVFENVELGDVLTTVPGTTNQGNVTFDIHSESVAGAFVIDAQTGVLTVLNATVFDYQTNPVLTAVINVINGNVIEESNVTVNLIEVTVDVQDLQVDFYEHPFPGKVIGTVVGTTNSGSLSYTIISESIAGAFAIDSETGVLTVLDASVFDYDNNQLISAQVEVSNNYKSVLSSVNVNVLQAHCNHSQQNFENFVTDLQVNQGYNMQYAMDAQTHEYTFLLTQAATICSIGYQGYDNSPYHFTLLEANTQNVLAMADLTFSTSSQDYQPVSWQLAPGKYIIRRQKSNYTNIVETNGNILEHSSGAISFPVVYNGFMTIEGSKFMLSGTPALEDVAIPYISLAFN